MKILTEEHKQKMQEGRERARQLRVASEPSNGHQEAMASLPTSAIGETPLGPHWAIKVEVDWQNAPLPQAQEAYARLKKEFERAGTILNSRSMPTPGSYVCFMCQITHPGEARGKDDSQVNPSTGLAERVRICGEECWISFQDFCIRGRSMRNDVAVGIISGEEYKTKYEETLSAMRHIRHTKMVKGA